MTDTNIRERKRIDLFRLEKNVLLFNILIFFFFFCCKNYYFVNLHDLTPSLIAPENYIRVKIDL